MGIIYSYIYQNAPQEEEAGQTKAKAKEASSKKKEIHISKKRVQDIARYKQGWQCSKTKNN